MFITLSCKVQKGLGSRNVCLFAFCSNVCTTLQVRIETGAMLREYKVTSNLACLAFSTLSQIRLIKYFGYYFMITSGFLLEISLKDVVQKVAG